MNRIIIAVLAATTTATLPAYAQTESHGWLNNDTLQTPYGTFQFKNGYPAG